MHLFTHSALLKALGWSLLNSMWQMALLWLLYLLVKALLNAIHRRSAGLHHTLAILILSIGSIWSGISFVRYLVIEMTAPQRVSPQWAPTHLVIAFMDQALPMLSSLYLGVLFLLAVRYTVRYRQSGLLRYRGLLRADPGLRLFVDTTRRNLGIHKQVSLWLSSFVEAPLTIGFLKPVILLPVAILNNLDTKQVEAILLHELAHIKRNDYLLNLLMTVVGTLFFFNPFAKWLLHSIAKEREHSCDDLVLQFRYDPHSYASALLLLAKRPQAVPQLAMAATGWDDRLLLQRVKRIMKLRPHAPRSLKKPVCCLLLASLAAFLSLFQTPSAPSASSASAPSASLVLRNDPYQPDGKLRRINVGVAVTISTPNTADTPNAYDTPHVASTRNTSNNGRIANTRSLVIRRTPNTYLATAPGELQDEGTMANVIIAEPRDFSITLPVEPVTPGEGMRSGQPYVPGSSFSYLLAANGNSIRGFTREQLGQAILLLTAIDWNKLEKQLSVSGQTDAQIKAQNLLLMKKKVLQKLLELRRVYLNTQPDPPTAPVTSPNTSPTPSPGSAPGFSPTSTPEKRHLLIVYI